MGICCCKEDNIEEGKNDQRWRINTPILKRQMTFTPTERNHINIFSNKTRIKKEKV